MAIAADTFSTTAGGVSVGSTTLNFSFNNAAGDLLVVGVFNVSADGNPTATYNSVSMTRVASRAVGGSTRSVHLYYLKSPATGTNTVAITQTGTTFLYATAASYSGTNTSSQPDSSSSNGASSATTLTTSTTVVASNCWLVGVQSGDNGDFTTGGAGTTQRSHNASGYATIIDSNGTVSTGSQSLVGNNTPAQNIGCVLMSIAPAGGGGGTVSPRKALLGVGI